MSAAENRLYFLMQLVAHQLKKRADSALKSFSGLTTAQAAALSVIAKDGPVSQRQVALKLSQGESAMMTMANRLLTAGFITRQKSKSDARVWELKVTDRGSKALGEMEQPFSELNLLLDDCLNEENMDRLADDLRKILSALSD